MTMSMDKSGQKRTFKDKAKEFVFEPWKRTLTNQLEKHDDDFARFLLLLRQQDDKARALMLGKEGKYKGQTMKSMVDTARELMLGRDYINSASYLSRFFENLEAVSAEFAKLDGTMVKSKNKTLLQHISQKTLDEMLEYYERHNKTASSEQFGFAKQASVFDWFKDQFDQRRRAMKFLEKKFPAIVKFRKDLEAQISSAEELLQALVGHFDKLSNARAESDINGYQAVLSVMDKDVQKAKHNFNRFFVSEVGPYILWYKDNMKNVTPEQEAAEQKPAEEKVLSPEEADRLSQEIKPSWEGEGAPEAPIAPIEKPEGGWYGVPQSPWAQIKSVPEPAAVTEPPPSNVVPIEPAAPAVEPEKPKAKPKKPESKEPKTFQGKPLPMAPPGRKVSERHEPFITKIAEMDEDDMQAIGQAIRDYSSELKDQDPIASMKLLAVAESLL